MKKWFLVHSGIAMRLCYGLQENLSGWFNVIYEMENPVMYVETTNDRISVIDHLDENGGQEVWYSCGEGMYVFGKLHKVAFDDEIKSIIERTLSHKPKDGITLSMTLDATKLDLENVLLIYRVSDYVVAIEEEMHLYGVSDADIMRLRMSI